MSANLRAFLVAASGIAIYTVMDALMKQLSIESGAYNAVLWRSIGGALLSGGLFVAVGRRWPARKTLMLHIGRGVAAGSSVVLFFWGLARVPMAQGVALTFLAPLIALYLAALFLGETIRRAAIVGSVVASAGVLVIAAGEVQADASTQAVLGSLACVAASVLYAGSLILLRRQAQVADPVEVAFFANLVIGAMLLPAAPWLGSAPAASQLLPLTVAILLNIASVMALAWAYARAEAQVLAPVEYSAFVWAALAGWIAFGETVSPYTVIGALLIVAGCVVAVRRRVPAVQSEAGV
ncbi:permease [Sphingomonas sp. Leaf24]|uniref:DMT family transporter n=1 Tax=unclassified Sphingomonas TaxID=196159 RepID=UPI0006F7A174|nr:MULTISPECIES: DMT family transporter [unclassified Sphingomonas]KQM17144.1 permease [Sphingomonas sp. Leaf5]KQM88036.1 permease [Sphingomonas sp. Leaf24]